MRWLWHCSLCFFFPSVSRIDGGGSILPSEVLIQRSPSMFFYPIISSRRAWLLLPLQGMPLVQR